MLTSADFFLVTVSGVMLNLHFVTFMLEFTTVANATFLGHSLYNYSLGSVRAVAANLFPLLESVLSSAFAVPLFS